MDAETYSEENIQNESVQSENCESSLASENQKHSTSKIQCCDSDGRVESNFSNVLDKNLKTPVFCSASTPGPPSRRSQRRRLGRRRKVSGFPAAGERAAAATQEVENLAEFESLTDSDSEEEEPRVGGFRVHHINYFKYFDTGQCSQNNS